MKEQLKKVLEFVKEHKKEILFGAGVTTVGILLCVVGVNRLDKKIQLAKAKPEPVVLDPKDYMIDLGIGKTAEILSEDNGHKAIFVDGLTIDDVGALGEKLREKYPEIPEHHNQVAVDIFICDLKENN